MEAVLPEETNCDEDAAQPYQRSQERRGKGKRAAAPRRTPKVAAAKDQPDEESDFELQLRSTLA